MTRPGAFWGAGRWFLGLSRVGVAPGQAFFDQPQIEIDAQADNIGQTAPVLAAFAADDFDIGPGRAELLDSFGGGLTASIDLFEGHLPQTNLPGGPAARVFVETGFGRVDADHAHDSRFFVLAAQHSRSISIFPEFEQTFFDRVLGGQIFEAGNRARDRSLFASNTL